MRKFENRVVVVTGAAMGIGKILSRMLLEKGCKVMLIDNNAEKLMATEQELAVFGKCAAYHCDITKRENVYELAQRIEYDYGRVSLLINNAGVYQGGYFSEQPDEWIERTIEVNLLAQMWVTKAFLPQISSQIEGHIVNIASASGILGLPKMATYAASKFGLVGFSDALRQEMKKQNLNIGVTVVCPNTVNTGMFAGTSTVLGTSELDPIQVCFAIVRGIETNAAMVAMPSFLVKFVTPLLKVLLPIHWMDGLNRAMGMWRIMDGWKGKMEKG